MNVRAACGRPAPGPNGAAQDSRRGRRSHDGLHPSCGGLVKESRISLRCIQATLAAPGDGRRRVSPCRSSASPGDQPRQSRSEAALLQWVSPILRSRMQDGGSAAKPINSHTGADARMTGGGLKESRISLRYIQATLVCRSPAAAGDGRRRVSPCRSPAVPGDQPRQSRSEAALLQWVSPVLRIRMQDGGSTAKPINSHTGAGARMTGGGAERVPGPG